MIDYIKAACKKFNFEFLIQNFDFYLELNEDTGEIKTNDYGTTKRVYRIQGLTLIILETPNKSKTLLLSGSIHKYWNMGKHNFNDFNMYYITLTLKQICNRFKLEPKDIQLQNIEVGFNIVPPVPTNSILKGLLSHRNKRFDKYSLNNGNYYQCQHSDYYIKIYDKALQYNNLLDFSNTELMRFEIKYVKMRDLNKLICSHSKSSRLTLKSLLDLNVIQLIGEHTLKYWNEILFYDHTIDVKQLSKNVYQNTLKWQNINQWEMLTKASKHRERINMIQITNIFSQNIQIRVNQLLLEKYKELLLS
jgi:hypothetical protein